MENQPVNPINNPSSVPLSPPTQPIAPPITPNPQINNLNKPKPIKKILLILILIISIVAIGFLIYKLTLKTPKDLAAKVGSEKITKDEVTKLATDCVISEKEAVEYLVDEKVLTKWANDEKILMPENPTQIQQGTNSAVPNPSSCSSIIIKVNALRQRLELEDQSYREGKFIIVNFDRYNPKLPGWPIETNSETERKKLLEEERTYADNLMQSIYRDLTENIISFEQAIEKVNNDPKVGNSSWYATSDKSGEFSASDYLSKQGLIGNDNVRKKVDEINIGKFTEPFIEQVDLSFCEKIEPGCLPNYVDASWVISKVDKSNNPEEKPSNNLLEKIREKYKAKLYL